MDGSEQEDSLNDEFQNWLIQVCTEKTDTDQRFKGLADWINAPNAAYCHPREEHLIPLHVCAGLSGLRANVIFDDYIAGKRAVAFHW